MLFLGLYVRWDACELIMRPIGNKDSLKVLGLRIEPALAGEVTLRQATDVVLSNIHSLLVDFRFKLVINNDVVPDYLGIMASTHPYRLPHRCNIKLSNGIQRVKVFYSRRKSPLGVIVIVVVIFIIHRSTLPLVNCTGTVTVINMLNRYAFSTRND